MHVSECNICDIIYIWSVRLRKVPKSLQAIIITMLLGMFIPKIFEITGVAIFDKIIIKGLLSLAFSAATICVGVFYSARILKGRTSGGKARISLYILFAIILLSVTSTVVSFIQSISDIILYILSGLAALLSLVLIIWLGIKVISAKKQFKTSQEKSVIQSQNNEEKIPVETEKFNKPKPCYAPKSIPKYVQDNSIKQAELGVELKTLYELWSERDVSKKCLTATNDENPDLKWVKIYKPPYANGKFYGYVLMNNAHNTVNGEIYFADRRIWRVAEN